MAINSSTEVALFQEFLVLRSWEKPLTGSLDEAVEEFRRYQSELTRLKDELAIGVQQCECGNVKELDANSIKDRLRQRLASERAE